MKKARLTFRSKRKTLLVRTSDADHANLACARDVLADSGTAQRVVLRMGTAARLEA